MLHIKFKNLSDESHETAKMLAASGKGFVNCYYHVGFSLELLIKACRAKRDSLTDWPKNERGAKGHQLSFVIVGCGLESELHEKIKRDYRFQLNWATVKDWDAFTRYGAWEVTEQDARDILHASANPTAGVRAWLLEIYRRS